MTHRVLFVVTGHRTLGNSGKETGYFLSEVTHPHKELVEAGYSVDFVTPGGGKPLMDPNSDDRDDPTNKAFLAHHEWNSHLDNAKSPSHIDPKRYAAIFYAGGHGAMWDFPDNERLANLASGIYQNHGIVGAVCHGPAGLVNVKLDDGSYLIASKKVTGFTDEEEAAVELTQVVPFLLETRLRERGAQFIAGEKFADHVEVDQRVVTGQNPQSASAVGRAMARLLESTPEARQV